MSPAHSGIAHFVIKHAHKEAEKGEKREEGGQGSAEDEKQLTSLRGGENAGMRKRVQREKE